MSEVCGDSAGSSWAADSAVFGRVNLQAFEGAKLPKITITLVDRNGRDHRYTLDRSGNYCFRGVDGGGGSLVIDVEGTEAVRRSLGNSIRNLTQHREDFDLVTSTQPQKRGTISAKFLYHREPRNAALYERAVEAEAQKDAKPAISLFTELVAKDPKDYIAWARLGSLHFRENDLSSAERTFAESIRTRPDFSYAVMNLGRLLLAKNNVDLAIRFLERATELEPTSAASFQLLGEAYIVGKQGTLGVEALNEALKLDPVGMADSHLLMAALYDKAGAKSHASREYKLYLGKKPDHIDRKKFEKYIKENPPESN